MLERKFDKKKVPDAILFDVAMTTYMEDNPTSCMINEYMGELYSYQDLEEHNKYVMEKEERLIEEKLIALGLNVEDFYER